MQKQKTHLKLNEGNYHGEVTGHQPLRHGIGQMTFNDGSFYDGQWMNDKRNGQGIFYFSSGNVYQGFFVNNKKEGYGEFYYAKSEEYYKGYWMNDKKHGQGEYFFRNGDKFEGFFVQDSKHGPGAKTSKNMRYEGVWENNLKNGSFEFQNLKTGKQGIIFYQNNKKVGIQSLHSQMQGGFEQTPFGPRAGERMNKESFSNYTHSYESPSILRQSSKKESLSNIQEKPADYPVQGGRLNKPRNINPQQFTQILQSYAPRQVLNENIVQTPNIMRNDIGKMEQENHHQIQNSNVGSIEIDINKMNTQNPISGNKEEYQGIQNIQNLQNQGIQPQNKLNMKETKSFKSYGSRTFKSNSQGTFNSSAKTTMKHFYDYKEFKEGMSNGQVNMKLLMEEDVKKPSFDQQNHNIPSKRNSGIEKNDLENNHNIQLESESREKNDMRNNAFINHQMVKQEKEFQIPEGNDYNKPQQFYQQNNFRDGNQGYRNQMETRFAPHTLAQIEERPELNYGNDMMGGKNFMPNQMNQNFNIKEDNGFLMKNKNNYNQVANNHLQ